MNIGKRGLLALFGLTTVFLLVALASACAPSQVIMRLNAASNSHAAVWDTTDSDYGVQICYDEIFSGTYNGADLHSCSSVSPVAYLSLSSNAHASKDSTGGYGTGVCYAGLTNCEVVAASTGCSSGKTPIIYMSGETNAHVATRNNPSGYPFVVCCRGAGGTITPPQGPTRCSEYQTQSECTNFAYSVADSDPGCTSPGNCICVWDSTKTPKCQVKISFNNNKCYCLKTVATETQCNNGVKTVTFNAVGKARPNSGITDADCVNPAVCSGGPVPNVPCGAAGELPFFGGFQFVLALMGILLTYSVFSILRKHS